MMKSKNFQANTSVFFDYVSLRPNGIAAPVFDTSLVLAGYCVLCSLDHLPKVREHIIVAGESWSRPFWGNPAPSIQ